MKFSSLGSVQSTRSVSCLKEMADSSVNSRKTNCSQQESSGRTLVNSVVQTLLVGGFLAASAAHAVTVDAWVFGSSTRILDTNGNNPDTSVQTTPGILGGERESFIETSGQGFGTVNVTGGEFTFNLDANTNGIGRFVWDGDPSGDVKNDPTVVSTNGLGGVDLTQNCSGGSPSDAFRFQINQASTGDVAITIDVWDMDGDTGSVTVVHPQGAGLAVLEFPFSSFTGVDFANTAPAVGVGAIRLTIDPVGADEDVVLQELGTCGYDFGDARGVALGGVQDNVNVRSGLNALENDPAGGPRHILQGPVLGSVADGESDAQGQDTSGLSGNDAKANGDDNDGTNDNDGVTFPAGGMSGVNAGDTYTVSVNVTNVIGAEPLVCGWIDFSDIDGDGPFSAPPIGFEDVDNGPDGNGGIDGERLCALVNGTNCTDQGSGEFDCDLAFTVPDDFNAGDENSPDGGADSAFLARFRVTNDWATSADSSSNGFASDGEVEDYLISSDSLPVSIHSFDSRFENGDLVVDWGTVSETRNAGFALWGDRGDGPELLTSSLIAGGDGDPLEPRQYSHRIAGVAPGEYERLFVTAVDVNGKERLYGDFEPGFAYGKPVAPAPIRWDRLRAEARSRMAELNQRSSTGGSATPATAVDVTAAHTGMIEVSHEQLTSAGLDLSDVPASRIAVTLKGEPVSRHVTGAIEGTDGQPLFGPGASVRFWADAPEIPDALYVDHYSFRIADDPANALPAASLVGEFTGFVDSFEPPPPPGSSVVGSYTARQTRDDDLAYNFASPLADPWYTARLRAGRNDTHIATFDLDSAAIPDQPATLRVRVGGLTDFPEAPDHRVVVELNGQTLGEKIFEGQTVVDLDLDVPAGLLQPGANSVRVVAPGGTQAPADIQLLDRIDLLHTRRLEAVDGRVLIERRLPAPGKRLVASGFGSGPAVAYARHDGQLIALETEREAAGKVAVLSLEQPADYWLSSVTAIHSPSNVRGVPDADLLAGNPDSDFIVIAHPAFMPFSMDESHPLNDFIAARQAEGWNTGLFDISAIQQQYGWGMPLPEAVNRFLAAADESLAFEHVLLVGGDSYDYTDNLGFGSISFIPTHYRAAKYIPHAPADPLLADLDGDGRPDKALGRWPVRSLDDLDSIVTKTLDWAGDPGELANAVWVTDSQDPNQASFVDQAAELSDALVGSGWPGAAIAGVHFDDIVPPAGVSTADAARAEYFTQLEQGRSLSGFVGHGSPAMWTFQGLLTPDDIGELYNEGFPTLIGTMTCYTTYFVSPTSDTVAHRWMNGYREDALGDPIPGVANGSVAVHGAGVLSSYDNNGWFARTVLQHQLNGETLGRAIELTRAAVPAGGDALFNWILLGDPTLRLD